MDLNWGLQPKWDAFWKALRAVLLAWWPTWGDPASAIKTHVKHISPGSQGGVSGDKGDLGELARTP